MQRISLDRFGYDPRVPAEPLLRMRSGETIVVETEDTRSGQTRTVDKITPRALDQFRADRDAGKLKMLASQLADGRACQVLPNTEGPHVIRVRWPRARTKQ